MATSTDSVAKLYGKIAPFEGTRLAEHPMERELTLRIIRSNLSSSSSGSTSSQPLKIADIGGGPGKLAFPLADDGHRVDLVDLTPDLVAMAQKEQDSRRGSVLAPGDDGYVHDVGKTTGALLQSISVGNALHASKLPAGSYDGVLLLGPLYHLLEEEERRLAVHNALQLARPGSGVVFCAFVSVAAHLRDIAIRDPAKLLRAKDFYAKYVSCSLALYESLEALAIASHVPWWNGEQCLALRTPTYTSQLRDGKYDTYKDSLAMAVQGYHTCAADARDFLKRHFADTAELIDLRSTEGILGGGLDAKLADAGPGVVEAWANLMYDEYSQKEEFLGCADHLVAVLRRK